jgi:hypothetical protein
VLVLAARHNITVHVVESVPELSRHGGIAAALSGAAPWEAAATRRPGSDHATARETDDD